MDILMCKRNLKKIKIEFRALKNRTYRPRARDHVVSRDVVIYYGPVFDPRDLL